jgi:hypothetical protein
MSIWKSIAAVVLCGMCCTVVAQQENPTPQTAQPTPPPSNPNARILFHRSDADAAAEKSAAPENAPVAKVTDQERAAITYTSYDLDIHLTPQQHTLSIRAQLGLRNDGDQPLNVLPIQLSSALNFEDVILNGKRLAFGQQLINSDEDHTGQLREAVIELPQPLAPKSSLNLDIVYSGAIEPSAKRLEQLGTPADLAAHSDWDEISADFVGLRGFGNVVWYPVSSVPALLGDGAKVFKEIAAQKSRQSEATIRMRVSAEFFDIPPTVAVLDGHVEQFGKPAAMPANGFPGVVTCSYGPAPLGFKVPTLFLSTAKPQEGNGLRIYPREEHAADSQGYMNAATMVQPLVQQWLGAKPRTDLTIIDLPESEDAPFEQGSALFTALTDDAPEKLAQQLAHGLAHVYFESPREWLNEGVASFIGSLWIEHTHDRDLALEALDSDRGALAFAEPASPGASSGEDLLHASDAVYYRTKAMYVLWMLRDVAGDRQLAAAFQSYDPAADTTPEYFERLVERPSVLDPAKDLKWFFDNWVYQDRGLPDLSIAGVYPSPAAQNGEYLVGIDILNDGYAEAEVPVTVRSKTGTLTERVRLPGKTRTAHRMLVQGVPLEVLVNDGTVPEVQATIHQRILGAQSSR